MTHKTHQFRHRQNNAAPPPDGASDGFPDFGSLDALEARIGKAELGSARGGDSSTFARSACAARIEAGGPRTATATHRQHVYPNAATGPIRRGQPDSALPPICDNPAAAAMRQRNLHQSLPGSSRQLARLAALLQRPSSAHDYTTARRERQRQTRTLEKIIQLLQRLSHQSVDAANSNPFHFGP